MGLDDFSSRRFARLLLLMRQSTDAYVTASEDLYALVPDLPEAERADAVDQIERLGEHLGFLAEPRTRDESVGSAELPDFSAATDFSSRRAAQERLLTDELLDLLVTAQEDLYALVPDLPEADRADAVDQIERAGTYLSFLTERATRAEQLASQAVGNALVGRRGIDDKLAGITAACSYVWALADELEREGKSAESHRVRWKTRPLDCTSRDLEDPTVPWADHNVTHYEPTIQESLEGRLWMELPEGRH
jgi:hypothetical protein